MPYEPHILPFHSRTSPDGWVPAPVTRWDPPASEYQLADYESVNSPQIVDLLIQMGRKPIIEALRKLATDAQSRVATAPENDELQAFAYSLAWHYDRLQKCEAIDDLIKTATAKRKDLDKVRPDEKVLRGRFDALLESLRGLTKYVKPQPGRMLQPIWCEVQRNHLRSGGLAPETVAVLDRQVPTISPFDILEGVISLLNVAPWVRKGNFFHYEYFAAPENRLEFLADCDALLPEAEDLMRTLQKLPAFAKAEEAASAARVDVERAWSQAHIREPLPPALGILVSRVLEEQSALKT